MLTTRTITTFTVQCDGPMLGANCPTVPIDTPTDAGLASILKGQGWRLVVGADGKIDQTQPIYCKACVAALQAAGKLGA